AASQAIGRFRFHHASGNGDFRSPFARNLRIISEGLWRTLSSHRRGAKLSSCPPRWIGGAHRTNDARGDGALPAVSATKSRSSPRRNSFPRFRKTLGKSSARRWIHHGI